MDSSTQKQAAKALANEKCNSIYIVGDIIYPKGLKNKNEPQLREKTPEINLIQTCPTLPAT